METVTVVTKDGDKYTIDREIANHLGTVNKLLCDVGDNSEIPLPQVDGKSFKKVLEYANLSKANSKVTNENEKTENSEMPSWEKEYCKMDQDTLFEIILAANYLEYTDLLDATCKTVAYMIKGKTPDEIRHVFNIENDFTEEELEAVKKENEWIEEK